MYVVVCYGFFGYVVDYVGCFVLGNVIGICVVYFQYVDCVVFVYVGEDDVQGVGFGVVCGRVEQYIYGWVMVVDWWALVQFGDVVGVVVVQ